MPHGINMPNPHEAENPYEAQEEELPRCFICGGLFRYPLTHGMAKCEGCGANYVVEHTDSSPLPDDRELARELAAELEEDGARMRDFQAAERSTGFRDRSHGG